MRLQSVAPPELIRADHQALRSYEHLDTTEPVEDLLLIQSLEGRAHNGSGAFHKRTYVNTTLDDVVEALEKNPTEIKNRRQMLIDEILDFAISTMNGEKRDRLVNRTGEPMLGISSFKDRRVNSRDILRGLYLGGLRDNPDIRKETERIYQIKIGGGRCFIIDIDTLIKMGFNGEILAHEPHEDKIADYQKRGLIVSTEGSVDPKTQRYFYIRYRLGPGQSDDAALVMAGILYNTDVALGVFLADAVDTLEKYAPIFKDQDGALAFQIGRGFKELNLTLNDAYELAFLSAIPEIEEHLVPDSSLRYLLSLDKASQTCALKTHLDFIEGKPVPPIFISYKRIPSTQFYDYINRRLANLSKFQRLAMPNLVVSDLQRPAIELMKNDFAVMSKDVTISDVIKKFRETKCDTIIMLDKNNRIVGVVRAADLLPSLGEKKSS